MNKQGSYYSQLVKGTALQIISNAISRFGYNVEFIPVKDTSDSSQYAKGMDNALMRQKELIDNYIKSEGTANESNIKDKFRKEIDKTIICLYNPTGVTLAEYNYINDRSKPHKYLQEVKALVGYRYAKVDSKALDNTNTDSTIPAFGDVIQGGIEFTEKIIEVESDLSISEIRDSVKESNGLTLVKILKDIVKVKFSVDISFMVASESLLHNLQFILLKNIYTSPEQTEQSISVEYKIDGLESNVIKQEYTYTLGELSGFGTASSDNKSKLYTVGLTINDIQGTLLSDYNLYTPAEYDTTYPIQYLLKVGTK